MTTRCALLLAWLCTASLSACTTPPPELPAVAAIQSCEQEDLHWQLSAVEEADAFKSGSNQGNTLGRLDARRHAQDTLQTRHREQIQWSHYLAFASGFSVLLLVLPSALRHRSRKVPDAWGARLVLAARHELTWLEQQLPQEALIGRATRYLSALETKAQQNHAPLEALLSTLERLHICAEAELATYPLAGEHLEEALTELQRLLPPEAA